MLLGNAETLQKPTEIIFCNNLFKRFY